MGVEEGLCMKGGMGETSYANNSALQRHITRGMRSTLEEGIRAICATITPKCLSIADLGSSSGPNTLAVLRSIVNLVVSASRGSGFTIPEFNLFMNDLPRNDFNTLFESILPGFYDEVEEEKGAEIACFVSGTPGSFYGRLFPSESVHFMHSSSCLHYLSQRNITRGMRSTLEEGIRSVCATISPKYLSIADLGSSSGPNTLAVLRSIIDIVVSDSRGSGLPIPEFNFFMNDLPRNDFNTLFGSILPGFYNEIEEEKGAEIACFVSGTPGSFYGRLFPSESIHFMHSSSSLHYLSQAPKRFVGEDGNEVLNKGSIYATKSSTPEVLIAYQQQFAKDFTMFLRCRSREIVNGGGIVLCFVVTHDDEATPFVEVTSKALYKLASQGRIKKEKLDAFNMPYYAPTVQQVKQLIEAEGSFILHKDKTFESTWGAGFRSTQAGNDTNEVDIKTARFITNTIRAAFEPIMTSEFGAEIMDTLFGLVEDIVMKDLSAIAEDLALLNLTLSLIRRI